MLRPFLIRRQEGPELPDRLAGARPGAAEQRARQYQEVPVAHGPDRTPFPALRKRGRDPHPGVGEHGDPLRIPGHDRLERHLGRWRRDVAEDVARPRRGGELIEIAAVSDDDGRIVPDDKREGGGGCGGCGGWWRLV